MTTTITSPNDTKESEEALLGAVLLDPACLPDIHWLAPEDFSDAFTRQIFETVRALASERAAVDPISVAHRLERMGMLQQVGGRAYLMALAERSVTTADIVYHARLIRSTARKRKTLRTLREAVDELQSADSADIDEIKTKLATSMLSDGMEPPRVITGRELMAKTFGTLANMTGDLCGQSWGDQWLDSRTLGLLPGEMYCIAASGPGAGKSALVQQIGRYVAATKPVMAFSAEMDDLVFGARELAARSEINIGSIMRREYERNPQIYETVMAAGDEIAQSNLHVDASPLPSYRHMAAECQRVASKHGQIGLIILDMLQHIELDSQSKSEFEKIGHVIKSLKLLARQMNCPLLFVSQSNRAAELGALPSLKSLYGSSWIESLASFVVFLTPLTVWEKASIPASRGKEPSDDDRVSWWADHGYRRPAPGGVVLKIEKNRYGQAGWKPYIFDGPRFRFLPATELQGGPRP